MMASGHDLISSTKARLRTILVLLLVGAAVPAAGPAYAGGGASAAAAVGSAGLQSCSATAGKVLYDCVAGVLDRMSGTLNKWDPPEARSALQTAASQLRAASNKAQALSAISQCRSVFASLVKQATAGHGSGLSAIVGVLTKAAQLIQSKG
ncbi:MULTISPECIES: hypothetical protein [Bradyrhizobium]|uniref:hypothetical protein n=1 Tax=Bradyrhizobium TaxID=374 RepID=UPI00155E19D2|nr:MULTISPECIES: hypothetical protein [Bradyrhizobium]MDD1519438.1 hypothetical protein [Bradyrhizobium sp. WBAH30]MDD1543682.1 hypothetical protein [Bradyrhizobium sp. WBAH41]MDD1558033.1 hypothetical protein [Bradyrhizobium sp. WBAH23]MDD1565445.1 hypothetical protein [Bradyrhizobium sp. WBAH33]MDD1592733.1 hypothetical protein [Bradyrhizobium sp. WBAH42]